MRERGGAHLDQDALVALDFLELGEDVRVAVQGDVDGVVERQVAQPLGQRSRRGGAVGRCAAQGPAGANAEDRNNREATAETAAGIPRVFIENY